MNVERYTSEGVLFEFADDATRKVYGYAEDGSTVIWERPYTAEENARADTDASARAEESNRASIEEALVPALADLQAIIDDTNANINQNPAARIKTVSRALRRTIRLVIRRFDSTS